MKQVLLSQLNKQSIDLQGPNFIRRQPLGKIGLQEHLRALQHSETVNKTESTRSLQSKSFKARHLRNGIAIVDQNEMMGAGLSNQDS
jgi:hypothetical protein